MKVDPRGQRFAAAITTVVLAAVLVSASPWLLALQAVVFAVGAGAGVRHSPYGLLYARFVRPRLAPPGELEDAAPPRFAQAVGLAFSLVGLAGYLFVGAWLGIAATAAALLAAFLNAAFGFCLGCEVYLGVRRLLPAGRAA
ncbi:DUF4395 domain-containing protein [Marinitenerispora sediminis]|uniref:DUF4395 domain-containing protein n=1 Tax=Marinitenerispora sediminis TaxID=1931232 RepID=A0A368T6U2_9ACTN|nr:DUF4395 domain-containing protein [Marinitenerispora sediminis]RCV50854.1 DUF4395 domain-containing protein [Marinitenerispora sediminis]RCV56493.1 DUF4395 domain-containing protein [Marinitenerispora sediminis]RCV59576.1 DUF4395 domain-containing protein [Marinitenerispora sediminis]